jgi:hypothetical protein
VKQRIRKPRELPLPILLICWLTLVLVVALLLGV